MIQARGLRPLLHCLLAIGAIGASRPAGAGRVESRWVHTNDPRPPQNDVAAAATESGEDTVHPGVDYHDVRITRRMFAGRLETSLYFGGGAELFPALRINGARLLNAIRLVHRGRNFTIQWVGNGLPESAAITGIHAEAVGYDEGVVYAYDRAPDGGWTRREMVLLDLHLIPVGQNMAQMIAGSGVALTALFAHPGPPEWWLSLAGASAVTAGGACALWLAGGWRTHVEVGPPIETDAP